MQLHMGVIALLLGSGCASAAIGDLSSDSDRSDADIDPDIRSADAAAPGIYVCPEQGAGCDYVGGDGLQQALVEHPGSSTARSTIILRTGSYSRSEGTSFDLDGLSAHAFLLINGQYANLLTEPGARLEGSSSAPMIGIAVQSGELAVSGLGLYGLRFDGTACGSLGCSSGYALAVYDAGTLHAESITVDDSALASVIVRNSSHLSLSDTLITNSQAEAILALDSANLDLIGTEIRGSASWALSLTGSTYASVRGSTFADNDAGVGVSHLANAQFRNNLFLRNFNGIYASESPNLVIENNTFDGNQVAAINLYHCGEHDPSSNIVGNIIVNTATNIDGSFGYAVGGPCWMVEDNSSNDTVHHNLIWQNARENEDCTGNENCGSTARLNMDPRFTGPTDYHLQPGSPAINSGVNGSDPDGSVIDRGAYGGPGACLLDANMPGC